MLRKVLGTVLLLGALVGCSGPASTSTCQVDADCGEGTGLCDLERGLCYAASSDAGDEPEVDPTLCEPRCAPYEACTASRICLPRYTALTVTPGSGSVLDGGVVPVTAELVLGGNYNPLFPENLDFSVVRNDGGTVEAPTQLERNAGVYTTQWTPPGEGVFLLTAAYPEAGGPSTTVQLTVDKTPPTFAVTVPDAGAGVATDGGAAYGDPSLANAWRRDQVVPVEIRTNEPNLDPSTLTVALRGTDGGMAPAVGVTSSTGACDAGFCGVAQLKLWEPVFDAFRGSLPIVVRGSDRAGNVGSTSETSVNVTRWKWVFDASAGGTFTIRTVPAIGAQGTVYFGTVAGSTGRVFSIRPDGSIQWDVNAGAVISGPTVGTVTSDVEKIYVGVNPSSTSAALLAFNGNTGAEVGRCNVSNGQIASNLALTQISSGSTPVETAVGLVNVNLGSPTGIVGALFALRPEGVASPCASTDPVDRGQVASSGVGPLVIDGDNVFFANTQGQLTSYRLGTATPRTGWPVPTGFPINGLALVGSDVVGANGGGSFSDQGRLFSIPKTGGVAVPPWSYPNTADLFVNQPSIGQTNAIFFGAENLPAPTSSPGLATVPLGGNQLTVLQSGRNFSVAPAIGRGGTLYAAASDSGLVGAWSTSNFTNRWTLTTNIGATTISPALDCARDATGTARAEDLGVLYVPEGGMLYAFVVDSRGLDPLAPWPKFQHDARNTGNPATPISSCP